MSLDERGWMYSGWNEEGPYSAEWVRNTDAFLDRAFQIMPDASQLGVKCPCDKCSNRIMQKKPVVRSHLFEWGFMIGYTRWTEHGESLAPVVSLTRTDEMPTADASDLRNKLIAAEEPLHSQTEVSLLSSVQSMLEFKSMCNIEDKGFDDLLNLLCNVLPKGHKMPANLYECKKMLSDLKMPSLMADKCINNCMVYDKENASKDKCGICGESRYAVSEGEGSE